VSEVCMPVRSHPLPLSSPLTSLSSPLVPLFALVPPLPLLPLFNVFLSPPLSSPLPLCPPPRPPLLSQACSVDGGSGGGSHLLPDDGRQGTGSEAPAPKCPSRAHIPSRPPGGGEYCTAVQYSAVHYSTVQYCAVDSAAKSVLQSCSTVLLLFGLFSNCVRRRGSGRWRSG